MAINKREITANERKIITHEIMTQPLRRRNKREDLVQANFETIRVAEDKNENLCI